MPDVTYRAAGFANAAALNLRTARRQRRYAETGSRASGRFGHRFGLRLRCACRRLALRHRQPVHPDGSVMFSAWYSRRAGIRTHRAGKNLDPRKFQLAISNGGKLASDRKSMEKHQIAPGAAASGILALLVDAREARIKNDKDAIKTEVLLDSAGLSLDDIAAATNKSYDAIRVSLSRSRRK